MAALLIAKYSDFIEKFMMNNKISDWEIFVVSYDIGATIKMTDISEDSPMAYGDCINYVSKYENVEFLTSLRPTYNSLEIGYGDKDTFEEMYYSRLIDKNPFTDICCISDLILNENANTLILFNGVEYVTGVGQILSDFFEEEFKINAFLLDDIDRLCENFGTSNYDIIKEQFGYNIPESFDGTNPSVIWEQITDDIDDAKKTLEAQKIIVQDLNTKAGMNDSIESIFFNKFTETLEEKLEYILNQKDIKVIKELCKQKGISVNRNNTKEFLVKKIIREIKKNSSEKIIDYEFLDEK